MVERGLSRRVVLDVAASSEIIEDYSGDRPTPTALLFGWDEKRPIHVVLSIEPYEEVAIITAYEPSLDVFEADSRTWRKPCKNGLTGVLSETVFYLLSEASEDHGRATSKKILSFHRSRPAC
jgi:hypothetical protein